MPLPYAVFLGTFAVILIASIGWQFGQRHEKQRQASWVSSLGETVLDGVALMWWPALLLAVVVALLVGLL
jgi:hypothetical protein